jgi:hypothetical protein
MHAALIDPINLPTIAGDRALKAQISSPMVAKFCRKLALMQRPLLDPKRDQLRIVGRIEHEVEMGMLDTRMMQNGESPKAEIEG